MVTSATYQPFESVYRNYLAGLASPFQRAMGEQTAPLAQLAYWTAPAASNYVAATGAGTNPFASFLGGAMGGTGGATGTGYTPGGMTSGDWQTRAANVALQMGMDAGDDVAMGQLQRRFGIGEDPAGGLANQAALVNAAVLANTPMALRGETGSILQNMFDRWQSAGNDQNYLANRQNVWDAFGLS
jgi:hypothetical protein